MAPLCLVSWTGHHSTMIHPLALAIREVSTWFSHTFSIPNSESSGHAGTVMGLVIFLQCLQVNMIFEM